MGKNISILLVIILLAVAGLWFFSSRRDNNNTVNENISQNVANENVAEENGDVEEFTITASNFEYSETEIRVKQGQTVRIKLVVEEGFQDWVVDEFEAATEQMQAVSEETIEFVADEIGEFEYYCSVGQHRQMGMVGKLIVE